jgi:hypothetical protein
MFLSPGSPREAGPHGSGTNTREGPGRAARLEMLVRLRKSMVTALGIGALAIPAAAVAEPGHGHGGGDGHGHGHGGNPTVSYVFKGTYGGSGLVAVDHGNGHVKKAGLVDQDVQFDLTNAKLKVADTNADTLVTADDIVSGDRVVVKARLPKKDPGAQPFAAKQLVDQTNPPADDDEDDGTET